MMTVQAKYDEALPLYEHALAICEKSDAAGPEHPDTAVVLSNLGDLYMQQVLDST